MKLKAPKSFKVICPLCHHTNSVWNSQFLAGWEHRAKTIVLCEVESGGCDKYFVADIEIGYTVKVGTMQQPEEMVEDDDMPQPKPVTGRPGNKYRLDGFIVDAEAAQCTCGKPDADPVDHDEDCPEHLPF